jgi:DNA mismatch endonuclease (patch repair protein)
MPRANGDYWHAKLARNRSRDLAVTDALASHGWKVVRAWEHEPAVEVAERVAVAVAAAGDPPTGAPRLRTTS